MIDLRIKIEPLPIVDPLIVRLRNDADDLGPNDAVLIGADGARREYDFQGFSLTLHTKDGVALDNDVIVVLPGQTSARRLIRADSQHNTFLITEQCDQLCLMCSQPPKKNHVDLFAELETAASLAPANAYIGLSGGEPLLHKDKLFAMLLSLSKVRPDLKFHILSNGQHLDEVDIAKLQEIGVERILWGIPLYAADAQLHDAIVKKAGAYDRLLQSFAILFEAGAAIELRTVVMQQNYWKLPALAGFVATALPFVERWAIMQLENIGFGRMNWDMSFKDTSLDFSNVARAINIATAGDVPVQLYNFPLCSVPARYRHLAAASISDWKNRQEPFCIDCSARQRCGGFFEWYDHRKGFRGLGPI
ncbi:His-Xaa-Ser system radical SAM maturase HxsC [Rhizobium sp. NLR10a]|uniref:His-Xaa-Ser system radical SAM maturase HxsC n=1 Tax=unclassified Rhizobium TaxID=2613769 RepID=UPI001C82DD2B|nr:MULTISPECIES: His-Xaa-Ser system radical SAM maturase HxsC [unclassified Rhizobium]MBX5213963.1 His-Xaa-Ser system radical SAM maturase HxsC [Rhizobium sp. NLR9a]MBX5218888.1 His-Xaa-Ser system radical SAM maturase HxsC [Rhizobium sp. NLR8a]MBX5275352.1 His-Xaa-Ser system radical SAM maturase HxsC [Rhizobium sp. NLR13a]MBX5281139.1 His-Xaa-Ser system radical SAM maturase HxsC [Rhizobium sp. NLR10a]MBX5297535.1 His-Xaa-Ser system radical SAM maturase HxsC [Rhizobium sp. NLR15a]